MIVQLNNSPETIHFSDITSEHLVVAIIHNEPCILFRKACGDGAYSFGILKGNTTNTTITGGNGYDISGNIKDLSEFIIKAFKTFPQIKMEVFKKEEWRRALKWLIDHA